MISPAALLLARFDTIGHLRLIARITPLPTGVRRDLGQRLHPAGPDHPGTVAASAPAGAPAVSWSTTPVRPGLVAESLADTAVDEGPYRHPVRFVRLRGDLTAPQVPPFGT
ncbi:hypothetical protein ABZ614_46185 [Streptomyces sp. NPDC013178]|uniref:hypothetical protein n=1 Tax=unclassified Streptomyces TaxID=2593676 RepID=UPI0034002BDF